MAIHVIAELTAVSDRTEELKTILTALIEPTRAELGCIKYELWQSASEINNYTFVEVWQSEAHLEAHLKSPHIQQALAQLPGVVASGPNIRRYHLIA